MVGITYDKERKRWVARTTVDGKRVYLGRFKTKREAIEALDEFTTFDREKFSDGFVFTSEYEETPLIKAWQGQTKSLLKRLFEKAKALRERRAS